MNSSTFISGVMLPTPALTLEPASLCAALAQLNGGRGKKGRHYRACIVLTLLVLAKLAGQTDPTTIARWVRLRQQWLCPALNLKSGRLPCANTYVYVCQKIELAQLNPLLALFFEQLCSTKAQEKVNSKSQAVRPASQHRHLAVDGKTIVSTLKGPRSNCQPVHLLELYEVETGRVLNQLNVIKKESEVTVAPRLLEGQPVAGSLISADAFHTQRSWCKVVKQKGADWRLIAKGNQPGLVGDLHLRFSDQAHWPKWLEKRTAQSWDKGHGRLEHRRLTLSTEMKEFLAQEWEGVEQVFCLERDITRGGKTRNEVIYGMLSLDASQASAAAVLEYVRRHWWIENRLHWRKDVTLKEDSCLSRRGQTPQVLAALNNAVLGIMDYLQVKNVPAQMANFAYQPTQALQLLVANIIL